MSKLILFESFYIRKKAEEYELTFEETLAEYQSLKALGKLEHFDHILVLYRFAKLSGYWKK